MPRIARFILASFQVGWCRRPDLDKPLLGELVDVIGTIEFTGVDHGTDDVLAKVYEYFRGKLAGQEGRGAGEFYTPRSVVRLLVEMLEPYAGRVYDPCCGSGGMFVQPEEFVLAHGGRRDDLVIYGQEFVAEVLGQHSLQPGVLVLDEVHRLVEVLAVPGLLGVVEQVLPPRAGRHPEDVVAGPPTGCGRRSPGPPARSPARRAVR